MTIYEADVPGVTKKFLVETGDDTRLIIPNLHDVGAKSIIEPVQTRTMKNHFRSLENKYVEWDRSWKVRTSNPSIKST